MRFMEDTNNLVLERLCLFLLLAFSAVISEAAAYSQSQPTIVESLPGYPGEYLPFKLETGYIGVGSSEEVQLFYYFIESERDVERDPLMLWLTGGPGCSGFSGLVLEIGPLSFNYSAFHSKSELPQFQLNPYSWTKVASIIFLDSPAGTGFSYATTSEAYTADDTKHAAYLHEFLRKWLVDHPKFLRSPLYVSGDSYSGQVIPVVLQEILDGNDKDLSPKINLKGYILGNPLTSADMKNKRVTYAHLVSLVSDELYESAKVSCNGDYSDVGEKNITCSNALGPVKKAMDPVNIAYVLEPRCIYVSPKPDVHKYTKEDPVTFNQWKVYAPEYECRNHRYLLTEYWANDKGVQKALRIREGTKDSWVRCNQSIPYTQSNGTSLGYHQNMTKKVIRALIYSGDQDMAVPYIDTLEWIEKLDVPIEIIWRPWFVDGQVAGYAADYSNGRYRLAYTTIKGGGHTAPEFKPRESFAMIDRWFALRYL